MLEHQEVVQDHIVPQVKHRLPQQALPLSMMVENNKCQSLPILVGQ